MTAAADPITWNIAWGVRKYDEDAVTWLTRRLGRTPVEADFATAAVAPYEDNRVDRNLLTTAGLQRITALIIGTGSTTALTNTTGRIGVGNGAGTAAIADTDLSAAAGSTNRQFQPFDATFPTSPTVGGVIAVQSTFTSALANFAWNEFGIDIGATNAAGTTVAALLLNHKTSIAQGTKTSGQSWTASATITLS